VEAVSAKRVAIKKILILLEQTYLERYYNDLGDNVLIGLSDTGYSNNKVTYQNILHFKRQSKKT
jgi:hypothetical protein